MKKIALFVNFNKSYGRDILTGIMDFKNKDTSQDWNICHLDYQTSSKPELINSLGVDGIIGKLNNPELAESAFSNGKKGVNISESSYLELPIPTVTFDNHLIGRTAAEYFIDIGIDKYICLTRRKVFTRTRRMESFTKALEEKGKRGEVILAREKSNITKIIPESHFDLKHINKKMLSSKGRTGIFAVDDLLGISILERARHLGIKVPYELFVLGVNDDPILCKMPTPELSSISTNGYKVGYKAAETLALMFDGKDMSGINISIPPLMISERDSTLIIETQDIYVNKAVNYIRTHINEYFDVEDLLKVIPICRRNLEIRFKKYFKKSIYQIIIEYRIKEAERMLQTTLLTGDQISQATGFPSVASFHRSFKQHKGMTPNEYRKKIAINSLGEKLISS